MARKTDTRIREIFIQLKQLIWYDHVKRMNNERIPKLFRQIPKITRILGIPISKTGLSASEQLGVRENEDLHSLPIEET